MRLCRKCNSKFEDDGVVPNPKCPKCGSRATKKMHKKGMKQEIMHRDSDKPSMWQIRKKMMRTVNRGGRK